MKPMTEENVKAAFAGESQAHMKYMAFATKAAADGFPNVARLFEAISYAEIKHAHYHLGQLQGVKSTSENLQAAYAGEDFEVESMYPAFTAVGELEGESGPVEGFHFAVEAEKDHRPMYAEARKSVDSGADFSAMPIFVCTHCGHTGQGDAPAKCPVCGNTRFKTF
jgi:rubrerythrin